MGATLAAVLAKLNADSAYARQFAAVYGQRPISSYQQLRALAQFTAALTSANSRYDRAVRHEPSSQLTAAEQRGRALFAAWCSNCHATDLFTDGSFRNNGLNRRFAQDSGRVIVTFLAADRGRFAVPSLRNVACTAPYMHDERLPPCPKCWRTTTTAWPIRLPSTRFFAGRAGGWAFRSRPPCNATWWLFWARSRTRLFAKTRLLPTPMRTGAPGGGWLRGLCSSRLVRCSLANANRKVCAATNQRQSCFKTLYNRRFRHLQPGAALALSTAPNY
jgi:hypothetical protein